MIPSICASPLSNLLLEQIAKLGPVIIAALVGFIGFLTYKNNSIDKQKNIELNIRQLNEKLFDRRLEIFKRLNNFRNSLDQPGLLSQSKIRELEDIGLLIALLFPSDVSQTFSEMQKSHYTVDNVQNLGTAEHLSRLESEIVKCMSAIGKVTNISDP